MLVVEQEFHVSKAVYRKTVDPPWRPVSLCLQSPGTLWAWPRFLNGP